MKRSLYWLMTGVLSLVTLAAQGQSDLSVTASGTPTTLAVGANLTYTVSVTVPAGGATGVTVTDVLPPAMTYVSGTPSCTNNQGTVTCLLGTLGAGTATVTIVVRPTASGIIKNVAGVIANEADPLMSNNSAVVTTTVTGGAGWTFTDDPLVAGFTLVKGVHITELRADIDNLRSRSGLGAAPWRDTILVGGFVKAIHIQDLRTYLNDALTRLGYTPPTYTDPGLTTGTVIKKVHIDELRQGVRLVPN